MRVDGKNPKKSESKLFVNREKGGQRRSMTENPVCFLSYAD